MTTQNRPRLLFFLWSALILTLLLVSGLPTLTFAPGLTFDLASNRRGPILDPLLIFRLVVLALFIYSLFLPLLLLVAARGRVWLVMLLLGIGLMAYIALADAGADPFDAPEAAENGEPAAVAPLEPAEMPEFTFIELEPFAGPAEWLVSALSLAVALLLLAAVLLAARFFWRRYRQPDPLADLAREAQAALETLRGGATWRHVILRCYQDMQRVVDETRGVRRPEASTPREFARQLIALGLPPDAVAGLTRLFEEARYGAQTPGPAEEERAISSLTAIVKACRGMS